MPIEFRCTSCSKLLRTPDESAGKKAKCPECGTIVDVPREEPFGDEATAHGDVSHGDASYGGQSPTTPSAARKPDSAGERGESASKPTGTGSPTTGPFADVPSPSASAANVEHDNPYAAPTVASRQFDAEGGQDSGDLRRGQVTFENSFNKTWEIFSARIGPCALVGLVGFGILIGLQIFSQIGAMVTQASGELVLIVVFQIISSVLGFFVQTFINVGFIKFAVKLVRTGEAAVNDLFAIGYCFTRALLATLVVALIYIGTMLVLAIPVVAVVAAIGPDNLNQNVGVFVLSIVAAVIVLLVVYSWLYMRLYLFLPFIVDRNAGVIESLRSSDQFMRGNKWMAFLAFLVASVLAIPLVVCTCYVGFIFVLPYLAVLNTVVYFVATGQPTSADRPKVR